ncbi:hypothetical protein CVT26_014116 [Gymnopilus dilepis]|uniref:Uncharacterized protein n=1 Tax=Gymnopilus dilepis TaxID=231916 RepID=A0A409Y8I3_9AGAR|nr:hypothetical protein CVT26_014116 [Gymnopilus dilepis]
MPRDRQQSSRSRSRSPRRYKDTDTDVHRLDSRKRDDTRPSRSARSRSRSRSRDRRSRSPTRRKDRRHRSRSSSGSRSRSRSRERRHKHRSRSRSRSRERKKKRRRSRSLSTSSEPGDDRSRRKKGRHREKDDKRARSKERRKEKKREKKERKEKVLCKKDKGTVPQWGKYGIISDIDIFTKGTEFHTWLVEERKINPETISKDQEKKEFSRFVEDYNTATLPHEKYYNMEAYERRMAALRSGEYLPPADDSYDFNADMTAVRGAHKKKSADPETYLSRDQLMELRKVGRMKLLGMDVKQNFGVRMDGTNFDE